MSHGIYTGSRPHYPRRAADFQREGSDEEETGSCHMAHSEPVSLWTKRRKDKKTKRRKGKSPSSVRSAVGKEFGEFHLDWLISSFPLSSQACRSWAESGCWCDYRYPLFLRNRSDNACFLACFLAIAIVHAKHLRLSPNSIARVGLTDSGYSIYKSGSSAHTLQ